ncbi:MULTISPECIES: magnesium and cobalt transport protein CorA [Pseudonocardia]|uniref:Magnesium transport protein CorA n=2 Tax=Pseudonocardia TaxID=1847 RepID=A0A1Y2N1V8_PSEAH|nr:MULTISPECIES: magnesium and cobalt transport protein CorA [Pseudonocardia]OSY41191.1 Magnesium transport protein CorA [Pseudonocardia autotrophica]TDN76647.1 magnesium transporter [Pseudonocardia autotrophica]BBG00647.1 magnesium transporter CorA [Pseudonocardia autotrophica]GEC27999.1 magnesium transporter CorA [Pseudonocardia saturnea]
MSVIDNAVYVDGRRAAAPSSVDGALAELHRCRRDQRVESPGGFCWIGMLRPDDDEIREVAKEFDLHSLAVEDTVNAHQRPKMERYGDTEFIVLRPARYVDRDETVQIGEVHLFLGPDFVITVRHAVEPELAEVRERLESHPDLLAHGPMAVLYAVLDRVVDDYAPVLDGLQDDIDQIEEQVFQGDPQVSRRIYQLTREVIAFQRAVEPLQEIFVELRGRFAKSGETPDLELRRAMRDVIDHATRVRERVEGFRDLLGNILTVNATLVAQRQNEEMTRLTEAGFAQNEQMKKVSSWAAILFAPSLIAGIYGMNFDNMPELHWAFGYPMAFGMMIALALILYTMFRRNGWL